MKLACFLILFFLFAGSAAIGGGVLQAGEHLVHDTRHETYWVRDLSYFTNLTFAELQLKIEALNSNQSPGILPPGFTWRLASRPDLEQLWGVSFNSEVYTSSAQTALREILQLFLPAWKQDPGAYALYFSGRFAEVARVDPGPGHNIATFNTLGPDCCPETINVSGLVHYLQGANDSFRGPWGAWVVARNDEIAPDVVLTSPVEVEPRDERFTIRGNATDASPIISLTWSWNGMEKGMLSFTNGVFRSEPHRLKPGQNRFIITARDAAHHETTVERVVTWRPLRTVRLLPPEEVTEGQIVSWAFELEAELAEVTALQLHFKYDPAVLRFDNFRWSSVASQSLTIVNADTPGLIRAFVSLAAESFPSGINPLGYITFRARSVPGNQKTALTVSVEDCSDAEGRQFQFGTDSQNAEGGVRVRSLLGDINANRRLDIGDATLMQQLLLAFEEVRPWDVSLNDLNGSGRLDTGDIVKVLRAITGADGQVFTRQSSGPAGTAANFTLATKEFLIRKFWM